MNRLTVCLLFSALAAFTEATKYSDCGSKSGLVSSVAVTDCPDGQDVCILKRGSQAGITINFKSKEDSSSLKAVVHGVIATVPMPFPIPQPDGCKSGVSCPVKKDQDYTYTNSLNIRQSYPPLDVTVRWELKDENGNDMVCVEMPCKLQ